MKKIAAEKALENGNLRNVTDEEITEESEVWGIRKEAYGTEDNDEDKSILEMALRIMRDIIEVKESHNIDICEESLVAISAIETKRTYPGQEKIRKALYKRAAEEKGRLESRHSETFHMEGATQLLAVQAELNKFMIVYQAIEKDVFRYLERVTKAENEKQAE